MTAPTRSPEVQALLIKAVDGEISPEERDALDRLAAEDPSIARELASLSSVHQTVARFGLRDPNPGDWLTFERSLRGRGSRWLGWLLMLLGVGTLIATGGYFLLADPEVPIAFKAGIGAVATGTAILFAYVGRIFWHERREDPYKDVVR